MVFQDLKEWSHEKKLTPMPIERHDVGQMHETFTAQQKCFAWMDELNRQALDANYPGDK
jgi:hypothetical protein